MTNKEELIKKWVKNLVIDLNLCPFAFPVFKKDQIKYIEMPNSEFSEALSFFCEELISLSETDKEKVATTLLILPQFDSDFDDYLDFLYAAENMLEKIGFKSTFQLASFHPHYVFDGIDENDVSNYTNRAPHSVIHIIREDDVEIARRLYKNIHEIPEENIKTMNRLGEEIIKKMLSDLKS